MQDIFKKLIGGGGSLENSHNFENYLFDCLK